jgi:hypothetical protein
MSADPVGERVLPGPLSSQPAQIQSARRVGLPTARAAMLVSSPVLMPCSRATSVGETPGERLCAAIVCFCSVVQRRHRSPRGISSIRSERALL